MFKIIIALCIILILFEDVENRKSGLHKKEFRSIGCNGAYDREKFERLRNLCIDCSEIFEDRKDKFVECRNKCFKNNMFLACIETLFMKNERQHLMKVVKELKYFERK